MGSFDILKDVGVNGDCCEETDKFCLSVCLSGTSREGFNVGRLTGVGWRISETKILIILPVLQSSFWEVLKMFKIYN